jgi:predicted metal-dependent hydrolase
LKKQIELHKRNVEYTLKLSKRSRSVRLSIYPDGNVVVTAPRFVGQGTIERLIFEKSKWILDKIDYFKSLGHTVFLRDTKADYIKYKEQAKMLAVRKVEELNAIYKFKYNRITIRNQKSRWGSCSKKGNLNFNYKIALLPEKLADYIVVHEICHLGEFNHSKKFWNLVAKAIPDYKEAREELRKIGMK